MTRPAAPAGASPSLCYLADVPQHVPELVRWQYAEWGHLHPGESLAARTERLRGYCGRGGVPSVVVACAGPQLLGSAALVANDMDDHPQFSPWLAGVFVRPDRRGHGIGSLLIRRIEAEAAAAGSDRLYLYTETGEGLYARLGWRVIDRAVYHGAGVVIMSRRIG